MTPEISSLIVDDSLVPSHDHGTILGMTIQELSMNYD